MTVVGLLMVFRAMRLGEVSWGEGVAKERRGLRTELWGSPAFIEKPEKDGQWEEGINRRVWCPQTSVSDGRNGTERSVKKLRI